MRKLIAASLAALALGLAPSAMAFTLVAGDVETDVETGTVVTVAAGFLAEAETSIGSINDGSIVLGKVETDVETGDVVTVAAGFLADACTSIGSIGGC